MLMPLMYPGGNLQKQPGKPLVLGYINYLLFKMHALRAALQCSAFFAVSKIPPQSLFSSLDRFHQVNHRAFRMAGLQAHMHLQQAPIHDVDNTSTFLGFVQTCIHGVQHTLHTLEYNCARQTAHNHHNHLTCQESSRMCSFMTKASDR